MSDSEVRGNDRRILHVDDDPTLSAVLTKRLAAHGYTLVSIANPREAFNEVLRGQYRLVLLDIDMPLKNGIELLEEIKQYDGGIQVIMLTGLVSVTTVLETMRRGAEACLFKPVGKIEPLVETLDDTFKKIDRWWDSLSDLMCRRKCETLGV